MITQLKNRGVDMYLHCDSAIFILCNKWAISGLTGTISAQGPAVFTGATCSTELSCLPDPIQLALSVQLDLLVLLANNPDGLYAQQVSYTIEMIIDMGAKSKHKT